MCPVEPPRSVWRNVECFIAFNDSKMLEVGLVILIPFNNAKARIGLSERPQHWVGYIFVLKEVEDRRDPRNKNPERRGHDRLGFPVGMLYSNV